VLVVLSKADLLALPDRDKMLAYVRRQFATGLGREVPVAPVSVVATHVALTEAWFNDQLASRQARHRELAAATLRRKAGALKEAVLAALERRAGFHAGAMPATSHPADLGAAHAALEKGRSQLYDLAYLASPTADAVIDAVAPRLAASPPEHAGGGFPEAVARELARAATELGVTFDQHLRETRTTHAHALDGAGLIPESSALPAPFTRPLFDPAPVLAAGRLSAAWRRWPGENIRRVVLRHHLRAQLTAALDAALRVHAQALVGWGQRYLDELAAHFNAQAGFVEARTAAASAPIGDPAALRRDLELLRHWAQPAEASTA
jgi:hypothetical protein